MNAQDVWCSLQTIWNNFFWLTGETPGTLSALVDEIRVNYLHLFHDGTRGKLDLKNKVHNTSQLKI